MTLRYPIPSPSQFVKLRWMQLLLVQQASPHRFCPVPLQEQELDNEQPPPKWILHDQRASGRLNGLCDDRAA